MVKKPSGKNKRRFQNRDYIRKNDKIRAREVRVIGPDGEMLGVMPPEEALKIAKSHYLDLVEVASNAVPPVCRILEFGKYKYELSKQKRNKEKTSKRVKEAKFRPRIEEHDYVTKLRRSEKFLHRFSKITQIIIIAELPTIHLKRFVSKIIIRFLLKDRIHFLLRMI